MKIAIPVPFPPNIGALSSIFGGRHGALSSNLPSTHKGTISYIYGRVCSWQRR